MPYSRQYVPFAFNFFMAISASIAAKKRLIIAIVSSVYTLVLLIVVVCISFVQSQSGFSIERGNYFFPCFFFQF